MDTIFRSTFGAAGRRRAVLTATAAVLSLATLAWWVAAPDVGGGGGGYLATGAAGPSHAPTRPVPPSAKVTMVPLPLSGSATSAVTGRPLSAGAAPGGTGAPAGSAGARRGTEAPGTWSAPDSSTGAGGAKASKPASAPPSPTTPSGDRPARLTVGAPRQGATTDQRWCENVSVTFANTGDRPATSGEVTFGTHITDNLLGLDWGTVDTTEHVPVPIAGGARVNKTWQICLDAWRVPLGTHIETESATLGAT